METIQPFLVRWKLRPQRSSDPVGLLAIETPIMKVKSKAPRGGPSSTRQSDAQSSCDARIDDHISPKPKGRDMCDESKTKTKLLSCKQYTNVATKNVRTIRLESKRKELAYNCKTQKIKVLGIVDHKIVHEEPVLYEDMDSHILVTTSAWRNSNNAAAGGVGVMIEKSIESALSEIKPWNERIVIAHFIGNPAVTIITHYSPVEGSKEAEEHYDNLSAAISEVPKHNLLMIMGDFNAHLGKEAGKYTFHEKTNKNGSIMKDFVQENGLIVTNTSFQKKEGKLWTFISDMSGHKSQVDFILVNKKWKNSVKNCEAYNSFSSMGSDHRIVTAKVKLSLRTCRAPPRKPNYDWSLLRDGHISNLYSISVQNRYEELCQEDESLTETYAHLIKATEEAAKLYLPVKKRAKKKATSSDPRIEEARKGVQTASDLYKKRPTERNREKLQSEKGKLQETYDLVTEEELESAIRSVELADERSNHGESWKLVNQFTGRKTAKKGIIKGKSAKDRVEKWYQHFKNLLGKEPVVEGDLDEGEYPLRPILQSINISDEPFSMAEYLAVKKAITEGKAPGPDGIPPEVLKRCNLDNIILDYANKVIDGEKPDQWSESSLVTLPKDGDLSNTDNYRGIALSAIAAKMTNKLILNRIRPPIDKHLRPNQNGFRPGRSTTAHILALRRVIEGVKSRNLKAVIIFVDFRKAFDSIHRERMMEILNAYDVPEKLLTAIKTMYSNTRAKVITPDGETEWFDILAGVLQGDTLAPFLFAIVLDYAMRKALEGKEETLGLTIERRRSRRCPPIVITDTDFADDIALLSEEISQAQEMLTRVETEALKIGLHLNEKKTEAMVYNQEITTPIITSKNGKVIKVVDNFKYLGGWMKSSEKDFEIRKALAWVACHKLQKIWKSNIKRKIKERLFLATVESILLYGSETWTLTKTLQKRLDGCYTRMLRMAYNISWKEKMTNVQLYDGLPPVSSKVASRRLKLAGHCVRHPEEEASKLILWEPTQGRSNVGRRAVTYIDTLKRDTGIEATHELKTAMMDRNGWRQQPKLVRAGARPK